MSIAIEEGLRLGDLRRVQEERVAIELAKLLTEKDKNLKMKTEIHSPVLLAIWQVFAGHLKMQGLKTSAKFMNDIHDEYLVNMVSDGRKSRKEIVDVVAALKREEEKSTIEKLLTRQEKD